MLELGAVKHVNRDITGYIVPNSVIVRTVANVHQPTENVPAWQGIMGIAVNTLVPQCATGSTALKRVHIASTIQYPIVTLSPANAFVLLVTMATIVRTAVRKENMALRVHWTAFAKTTPTAIT